MNADRSTAKIVETPGDKDPSSLKLVSALGIAGLFSGIILVTSFLYTNPMILANKEAAIQRAIFKVLPGCTSYRTLHMTSGELVEKVPGEEGNKGDKKDDHIIYAGYKDQTLIGFAVPGSEPGFQDIITAIFGYDGKKEMIIGFEVLDSKETPGLGDKIFKDLNFQTNFKMLSGSARIEAVKKGEKKQSNEVEAITGATISSKAVVRLLNNSLDLWRKPVSEYLRDNSLKQSGSNE
jgi:electron transport complex protein RnfG